MDPFTSGQVRIEPDDEPGLPQESLNGFAAHRPDQLTAWRADIDEKQEQVGGVLDAMGCEAALLLMPAHVTWFTGGMNVRGLIADGERPGVFTNGRQRWLLCSNVDTHRLFDEELDQLGFQLKEWTWESGRADLLANIVAGRKVAFDRPFPNMPMLVDRLRPLMRILSPYDQETYRRLGGLVAHAVEATARNFAQGEVEEEIAGQLGHRLLHHGADPVAISITADGRGEKFRRAGFTSAQANHTCVIQVTAQRDGLYASASRSISFGPIPADFSAAYDRVVRLAAIYSAYSVPGENIATARAAGQGMLENTHYEYEGRLSQPGYGAGRFPAEELRRAGHDEYFGDGQALVWQPRVGPAAAVETVIVTPKGGESVTGPQEWPFKRVKVGERYIDVPDVLVRPT